MTETQAPNWIDCDQVEFSNHYCTQLDRNAKSGSPHQWRYRKRAHTGELVTPWSWGQPPTT